MVKKVNKRRIDIMTDLETLGLSDDSTVFQVAAVKFDIHTGNILEEFNEIIDISKEDIICNGDTIKWWLNTDVVLFERLLTADRAKPGKEVFEEFHKWLNCEEDDVYLWGNGIKFDNVKIDTQMRKYGLEYPIFYRNDRDVRTILDLASMKTGLTEKEIKKYVEDKTEKKHDALDDCLFQVRCVCTCYKYLNIF